MLYRWKVRFLKTDVGFRLYKRWRGLKGDEVGDYHLLPGYVRQYVSGRTFADIGCMWGVNGEYSFVAEEAGATLVKAVDVFGPTPEFEAKKAERNSSVEFILGDVTSRETTEQIGEVDVVLCAGVLYHLPNPFELLVALRQICRQTLILRTSTIPENNGLPNAAVYYPMLGWPQRKLWDLSPIGVGTQIGISGPFDPSRGYGNWFWGLTPSCVKALLETAGFRVDCRATEPFAQTFICTPVEAPLAHHVPDEGEARRQGKEVSQSGLARPS